MDDNYGWNNYKIPAFGNWDYGYNDDNYEQDLPYTHCFNGARQAGLVRYGSYNTQSSEDRDLYVAGDLYQNDVITPAFILVPRSTTTRKRELGFSNVKEEGKKQQGKMMQRQKQEWGGYSYDIKTKIPSTLITPPPIESKVVDQDLYKIPPEFLHVKPKKKGSGLGLFSSCLMPTCV